MKKLLFFLPLLFSLSSSFGQSGGCNEPDVPTVSYSPATICEGEEATLSISGNLNDALEWVIYSGSCGGILVGSTTNSAFSVTPTFPSTTYYVRGEGGCATSLLCGSSEVTVTQLDNASFQYAAPSYCVNGPDANAVLLGLFGGFYSAPTGVSIGVLNGTIDVSASTPGTYNINYTTNGTCPNSSSVSMTILAPEDASFSYPSNSICLDEPNPVANITGVSGGTFDAIPFGMTINSNTGEIDLANTIANTYTVTYSTTGYCANSASETISINTSVTLNPMVTSDFNGQDISCVGASDGSLEIGVPSGTVPLSFAWDGLPDTTYFVSGLPADDYTVTVTDANGCSSTETVTLNDPPAITISISSTPDGGTGDGTATATASGGTGSLSYDWDDPNSQTTITAADLVAGTYTVTVTDDNQCQESSSVVVEFAGGPADDNCDGANDINNLFGGTVNIPQISGLFDNTGYSTVGDPNNGFTCFAENPPSLENTIWFSFTGDGNTYRIRTVPCNASAYNDDTQAAIYSNNCNNGTPVACNDDEDVNQQVYNVLIDIETSNNVDYYMLVDGYDGNEGEFCIEVTRIDPSGLVDHRIRNIDIYPNPAVNSISWNFVAALNAEILDNTGRVMLSVANPNGKLDISSLSKGIYVLSLYNEDGLYTSRFLKM